MPKTHDVGAAPSPDDAGERELHRNMKKRQAYFAERFWLLAEQRRVEQLVEAGWRQHRPWFATRPPMPDSKPS